MFINVGKSKWMKVVLFITTFAFVGTAFVALILYKLSGNIQGIAKVNGKEIPMAEFYYQVEVIKNQMQSEGLDTSALKKQIYIDAVRNVIDQELLYQEAQREGLEATKEEVKQYLLDIDAFKEDGKFSKTKYLAFLSQVGLSPQFFEEILRKELSIRHLLSIQQVSFYLSEDEINTYINKQLAKITGEFVVIKPPQYKPSEKELEEYYEKHKSEFGGKKGKKILIYKISIQKLGQEKSEKEAQNIYSLLKSGKKPQEKEGVKKIFDGVIYEKEPDLPEEVLKELEKLSPEKRITLVTEDDNYYLIKYEKDVSQPLPFSKVKEKVASKIKSEKEKQEKEKLYKELKEIVKQEKNIKNIAINYRSQVIKIKKEDLQNVAMEFGLSQDDLSSLIKEGKGKITGPFKIPYGVLIARIENIEPPDKKRKEEMEKLLVPILKNSKYQTLIQMLIDKLKEDADIVINRRVIQ